MKGRHILLGVTGSVAACKSAELTTRLVKAGAEVVVIMTESAQRFVTPLTFEALSRRPVITSLWQRTQFAEPVHVTLADWTDLMVVAPATANFLGKYAHGVADDMLTCMAITLSRPLLIAPAMNVNMYAHAAVRENVALLKKRGNVFVGPVEGRLASGLVAMGRMADVADIVAGIGTVLAERKPSAAKG
jgi:phosphopantothenoylcysteine decarboxylase/phosphopantothenate--cysteine ligase